MAYELPKPLNFVEYQPSMVGIPEQAVGRLYDRLDAEAFRTEAMASKTQRVLAEQLAIANEGDKAYLQDLYTKLDTVFDTAKKENNLPGHARQIRNLITDMTSEPVFAAVLNNSKRQVEAEQEYKNLVSQIGVENVVMAGDDRSSFSTVGPDGQVRQFQSLVQKRPDYLKGMDEVFMRNTDIVSSMKDLESFVYNHPPAADTGFGALEAYQDTQTGRIHVNDLSRQMFNMPFNRLTEEQNTQVLNALNQELYNAGSRFVTTKDFGLNKVNKKRIEDLKGEGIQTSGLSNITLSDGTEKTDSTIMVYDDRLSNSRFDTQLRALFENDKTIPFYITSGNNNELERTDATGLGDKQIEQVKLTSGVGPNGGPLAMIQYKVGENEVAQGYAEIPLEDLPFLREQMGDTIFQVKNYTEHAAVGGFAPAITNIYEPAINQWFRGSQEQGFLSERAGIVVELKDGRYRMMDSRTGQPILDPNTDLPVNIDGKTPDKVREILGLELLNM